MKIFLCFNSDFSIQEMATLIRLTVDRTYFVLEKMLTGIVKSKMLGNI